MTLIGGWSDENIRTFISLYVIGNIIALAATGFLLGPKTQCRKMWHPTRRYSTAFYLVMLVIVFALAVAVCFCSVIHLILACLQYSTSSETKYWIGASNAIHRDFSSTLVFDFLHTIWAEDRIRVFETNNLQAMLGYLPRIKRRWRRGFRREVILLWIDKHNIIFV